MSLVKWMRKNNKKIMAVVVILLMIAFVGGAALDNLLQGGGGANDAVAFHGKKVEITPNNIGLAAQELEILQSLQMDAVLQQQDLHGVLLGQLLFSQSRADPALMSQVMQMIRRSQYYISDKQLSAIYDRGGISPAVHWILLRDEAEAAGIRVPTADVGGLLSTRVIPQLFGGQGYPQVIGALMSRFQVSEDRILDIVGSLLAVRQYAQTICSMENVTTPQLTHLAAKNGDSLNAEFVQIESRVFADKTTPPAEDAMQAHFDKYKGYFAGSVNEANPFGFGYRLPDRVQLDYIVLKLEDVARIVPSPTQEEAETYYRQNRQQLFTREVPSDPNDPNSPRIPRVTSYAQVVDTIMEQLKQQKIITKAQQILEEVRTQADAELNVGAEEGSRLSIAELKKIAEEHKYSDIAQELAAKHNVPLYSGQTGWLSAVRVQMDKYLARLYVSGLGANPVRMAQAMFSVDALGENAATLMFAPSVRMYVTLGPASDPTSETNPNLSGQIMLVARIVGVSKAAEPEGLHVTFSTKTLDLGETTEAKDNIHSVKEKVAEDLQNLAAWDATKGKAQEFVTLATQEGWDPAVAKFNDLYGKQAKEDPNDPNVFKLDTLNGLQRMSDTQLEVIAVQVANNPGGATFLDQARTEKLFVDRLFSLVPADANSAPNMPQVMAFEPSQSVYALKSASVTRLSLQQYERMKGMLLQQEDYSQAQTLGVVHFNPANILKRTNFRYAGPADEEEAAKEQSEDAAQ